MIERRRQSVRGFCSSSRGTGSPRAVKYSATTDRSYMCVGVVGQRFQPCLCRAQRLRDRAFGSDLDLDGVLAVDLFEAALVDLRGLPVERDLATLQRDDARSVAAREREEVQRADDGDAVLLVDLLEVLHDGVARRGVEARDRLVGQHDVGVLHERASDANTLLLATG